MQSRTLKGQELKEVQAIVQADVEEALSKYGRGLEIRRPDHPLFGRTMEGPSWSIPGCARPSSMPEQVEEVAVHFQ